MADNIQHPVGPQPDFTAMSQCFYDLGSHIAKVPNTPQFDTGNAILETLTQITERLNKIDERLNKIDERLSTFDNKFDAINIRLDAVNTRLDGVDMKIQVGDHNNAARIANSLLLIATEVLTPLHNPRDNTPVPNFPNTPGDIGNMPNRLLTIVLEGLGLETDGQKLAKEQRLRQYIGLKKNPA